MSQGNKGLGHDGGALAGMGDTSSQQLAMGSPAIHGMPNADLRLAVTGKPLDAGGAVGIIGTVGTSGATDGGAIRLAPRKEFQRLVAAGFPPETEATGRKIALLDGTAGMVRHDRIVQKANLGRLIGVSGTIFKELTQKHGANLFVLDKEGPPPGYPDEQRLVVLIGSSHQVAAADTEIAYLLKECPNEHSPSFLATLDGESATTTVASSVLPARAFGPAACCGIDALQQLLHHEQQFLQAQQLQLALEQPNEKPLQAAADTAAAYPSSVDVGATLHAQLQAQQLQQAQQMFAHQLQAQHLQSANTHSPSAVCNPGVAGQRLVYGWPTIDMPAGRKMQSLELTGVLRHEMLIEKCVVGRLIGERRQQP